MYIAIYTLNNSPDKNFLIIEKKDLSEIVEKLEKNGNAPKIKLYKMTEVKYKITYKDIEVKKIKKVPVLKEL